VRATEPTSVQQPVIGAFVQGLVAAVALGELTSSGGGTVTGTVPLAIGLGVAAAVFAVAGPWLAQLAGWFYSVVGIVAFIPTAIEFVRSSGCLHGPPPVLRFLTVALLTLVALTALAASALSFRRIPAAATGLALFGALQTLITAGTFIAGQGGSQNGVAIAVLVPGSALLGWFVVRATDAVLGVAGVALGLQSIYAAAIDPGCGGANFTGVVLIVVFCGAYFATRAVAAPFAGRR
jgi:hypothetical protein